MNQWYYPFLGVLFFSSLLGGFCTAQEMIEGKTTERAFPTTVTFTEQGTSYTLKETGVAMRKKLFVKIYRIAHYMQDPKELGEKNLFEEIIRSKQAKQLTSHWLRHVKKEKIVQGYRDAFEKELPQQTLAQLQPTIEQFFTFLDDVNKNDIQVIRALPDWTIIFEMNGNEKGRIQNKESFAQALWSIWFGPHSVVNRNKLVSQLK